MNKLKLPILLIFLTVTLITNGQNSQNDSKDSLCVQIFDCDLDTIELIVPSGWDSIEIFEYMEGFIKTFKYSDGSIVSILCGANAKLSIQNQTLNSRKIIIEGYEIVYELVPDDRVHLFDKAFDRMIEK